MMEINFTANKTAYVKPVTKALVENYRLVNKDCNRMVPKYVHEGSKLGDPTLAKYKQLAKYRQALDNATREPFLSQTELVSPEAVKKEVPNVEYFSPSTPLDIQA